jgi:hypothetical protein
MLPLSFHSLVLVFILITAFFLVTLLTPLPKFAHKIVIGFLGKINAKIFFWPTYASFPNDLIANAIVAFS